jgi:hypothetical protein
VAGQQEKTETQPKDGKRTANKDRTDTKDGEYLRTKKRAQ